MTPAEFFTKQNETIKADPDKAKAVGAVYLFDLTGDNGGKWTVDLKDNLGATEGDAGNANCTITMDASDFVDMVEGRLNGQMAFMSGKLKVQGDMSLAMKLQQVIGG